MHIGQALSMVGEGDRADSFELFSCSLDPEWIQNALDVTGTVSIRRRKFPAEYALWTVIGMGLLRDRSIQEVVAHLRLVLPDDKQSSRRGRITSSAVVQARDRLGSAPLETLFELTSSAWAIHSANQHRWRGLALYGIDGTAMRVADTPENEAAFKRPGSGRDSAAYPQARIVGLMVLRSHLLAGMALGSWNQSELSLAEPLWDKIPEKTLTLIDKGFLSYTVLQRIQTGGAKRHWLVPAKKNLNWTVVQQLGPDDDLVEITPARTTRRKHPELPETMTVRAIRYQRRGFQPRILLTSLLDPNTYPAHEILELYHERWEIEIGYDEIKTHTLERQETLRSRSPERVRQEIWGIAIGYNLVRLEMERVASREQVPPNRISYRHALMLIRNFWVTAWIASPGVLSRRLETMQEELALLILPPRRKRAYPRAVKIKMNGYPRKR